LYQFETLICFKELPIQLDAAIQAPLPLLETLSNLFNGNAVEGRQRFSLNLCKCQRITFLLAKIVVVSHPHHLPDHAPCDLFGSHGWSRIWRAGNLLTLQRFNKHRWWPLIAFPLKILDNVSSIGSGAGIAASSRRGSTSKGTEVSNLYKYLK